MSFQEPAFKRRTGFFTLFIGIASAILAPGPLSADITVTQLANDGVILSDSQTRIMIDGMVVEPYSVYGGLDETAAAEFSQASGSFAGIDLALSSHRHHDHNQPDFACQFLQASPATKFISSPQVLGLMREKCRQLVTTSPRVVEITPQYGEPQILQQGDARVTVFPLSHGTRKYAKIQNYAHLVELGGVTVLHIGDAAMDPADFQKAGLDEIKLDVVLIPFWYFQPGPGADVMNQYIDAPLKIAVHIPPGEMDEIRAHMTENYPAVMILESPLKEVRFSSTVQPVQ
jgi:L-ascorbate metabolism protein UlaG (beta-lactamase superfamily)